MLLESLLDAAHRFSRTAVRIGGMMILFSALMVCADVLARRLLGVTMSGSDEISGYLFAIATALSLPYALLHRANVRIDAAYALMPARLRYALDLFGLTLLTVFASLVTWRAALAVQVTWDNGSRAITPLQTPLILPQSAWLAGWLLLCLCLLLVMVAMIAAGMKGDLDRASHIGGIPSVEDEIREETAGVLTQGTMKEA
jgi:TRAP-type C4-dicarboxylate transport system permease small subunit